MIDLRAAPGEGATVQELIRYIAYLREQIMYLEDLRERRMAELMAAVAATKEE
jgi:hypothetical protein